MLKIEKIEKLKSMGEKKAVIRTLLAGSYLWLNGPMTVPYRMQVQFLLANGYCLRNFLNVSPVISIQDNSLVCGTLRSASTFV